MSSETYGQEDFPYQGVVLPDSVLTELHQHQLHTVEWMIHRELFPYRNIRGGLLLSEMGTGKSLCALTCAIVQGGSTLIVVPAQLVYTWKAELDRHFRDVPYFVYHGPKRHKQIRDYCIAHGEPNILITSLSLLAYEFANDASPLRTTEFKRIIFDECHALRNMNTVLWHNTARLVAPVKWFLSGTPMMNRLSEIDSYLILLGYTGMRELNRMADVPDLQYRNLHKVPKLRRLLQNIAFRRTKAMLTLPEKNYTDHFFTMTEQEATFYALYKKNAVRRTRKLMIALRRIQQSFLSNHNKRVLRMHLIHCVLTVILHLRLICCDPLIVVDKVAYLKGKSLDECNILLANPKQWIRECGMCFNAEANLEDSVCKHALCSACWKKMESIQPMRCFTCLTETTPSALIDVSIQPEEAEQKSRHEKRINHASTKTENVLRVLQEELDQGHKVIVVSQWTLYLDQLISTFRVRTNDQIPYVHLHGKIQPIVRQDIVNRFQKEDSLKVCFATLGSSAEGITLSAANVMILTDLYWNQARVEQMSDRVHRIGQTKPVKIHRLYLKDSIEIKLRDLVEQKSILCKVVVDGACVTNLESGLFQEIVRIME